MKPGRQRDAFIMNTIGYSVCAIAIIAIGVITFTRGGTAGLTAYALTVGVACALAFLSLAFVPWGSHWMQVGFWLLPVTLLAVIGLRGHGGGWLFAYLLGLQLASNVALRRRRRTIQGYGGKVLLSKPAGRLCRTEAASLTLASFQAVLPQLGHELQPLLSMTWHGRCLNIYGEASGPMVVYASLHPEDSDAWKRLVNPEHPASDLEVPVQVGGNIEGSYPRQNTVDVALARQAGEHFIRTGQLDPALTWEEGPEMFDRLPPTRLHR